jgi:hypothetical protein
MASLRFEGWRSAYRPAASETGAVPVTLEDDLATTCGERPRPPDRGLGFERLRRRDLRVDDGAGVDATFACEPRVRFDPLDASTR